jgi:hypothetical protein
LLLLLVVIAGFDVMSVSLRTTGGGGGGSYFVPGSTEPTVLAACARSIQQALVAVVVVEVWAKSSIISFKLSFHRQQR